MRALPSARRTARLLPLVLALGLGFGSAPTQAWAASEPPDWSPALPAPGTAGLVPGALGAADVARYRQIFALQRQGHLTEADQLGSQLDDPLLVGHVRAERYLRLKAYKSSYDELSTWLEANAELPQAGQIYRLAVARAPRHAKRPPEPVSGFLGGAGQELKEECFGDAFERRFDAGIDAWRARDYGRAATIFTGLAGDPDRRGEELAASAFWAARSQLRARHPERVAGLLRRSARASDEFYGLLAQRLLDETIRFEFHREELRGEMAELSLRFPAVRRAIALAQIGETDLAEAEVRKLAMRVQRQDTQTLTALAGALQLPSAQMRLAQQLRLIDGRRHDGAMFPIPAWKPLTGFKLKPSLVYAFVRAESAFDLDAQSPRGALGLMQVMPDTAAIVAKGLKVAYDGPDSLFQPEVNLEIGQTWLRRLTRTDTVGSNLIRLIVAYNAGEARLKGWLGGELKGLDKDPLLFIESLPLAEPRAYVRKVLANLWSYEARFGEGSPSLRALAENRWPVLDLAAAQAMAPAGLRGNALGR